MSIFPGKYFDFVTEDDGLMYYKEMTSGFGFVKFYEVNTITGEEIRTILAK